MSEVHLALKGVHRHYGEGETLVHVLVDANAGPADRIAAARAAEGLRRKAEDFQKKGAER